MNKKILIATGLLAGVLMMTGATALAQESRAQAGVDEDIKLFRTDIRSGKKQIIAANMKLNSSGRSTISTPPNWQLSMIRNTR
jgi:hypothetical protein